MALQRRHGTQEAISKAQALEFFLSSIRDPHNPQYCVLCLDGAFRECTDVEKWTPGMQKLKNSSRGKSKYNPELWNAIVKWLFIKRTKKQMERFLTSLMECTCRMDQHGMDVQRYHQISAQRLKKSDLRIYNNHFEHESEERQKYIKPWCLFLFNLFNSLSVPIQRSGSKSLAKGSSTSWPNSSTDLVPYGADALVASILQWHQFIPDPLLFDLMASILKVCRELVVPSLEKYRFTMKVVDSMKELMVRMVRDYWSDLDPKPMGYAIYVFPWQMADTLHYLGTSLFTMFHDDHREALFRDCEMKAMQLCSLILYIHHSLLTCRHYPGSQHNIDFTAIVSLGQELFRLFQMHLSSRPSIPVHPFIKQLDQVKSSQNSTVIPGHLKVLEALRFFRVDMRCSNRGCSNSLHTVGKDFQRCAKCCLAGYCGRECQKEAWKDEDYPHKRICPIISNMVEKAGGITLFLSSIRGASDNSIVNEAIKEVLSNWNNAEIGDDDLKLVTGWRDAVNALRGFSTPLNRKRLLPGFSDYSTLINLFSNADGAPKRKCSIYHRYITSLSLSIIFLLYIQPSFWTALLKLLDQAQKTENDLQFQ